MIEFLPQPKPAKAQKERRRYMTTKPRKVATSEADKRHMLAVKGLPCCICGAHGHDDAHHTVMDRWGGKRASHWAVVSLCKPCHWMVHKKRGMWNESCDKDWMYIQDMLKAIYGSEWSVDHGSD